VCVCVCVCVCVRARARAGVCTCVHAHPSDWRRLPCKKMERRGLEHVNTFASADAPSSLICRCVREGRQRKEGRRERGRVRERARY